MGKVGVPKSSRPCWGSRFGTVFYTLLVATCFLGLSSCGPADGKQAPPDPNRPQEIEQGWFGVTVSDGEPKVLIVTCDDTVDHVVLRRYETREANGVRQTPFEPIATLQGELIRPLPGVDGVTEVDISEIDLHSVLDDAADESTDVSVDATYFTPDGPAFGSSLPSQAWPVFPMALAAFGDEDVVDISAFPEDLCR